VDVRARPDRLVAVVRDDGIGGAHLDGGTGLRGLTRRLEAFDGVVGVRSPAGGPTTTTLEVPCEWSSPKTSPFSATG
jgi:signal transduction histidine kinase